MSVLSIVAFITGCFGVYLTIRQSIWCWPMALISVLVSVIEFYNERLFGDMSLQVFYFFAGIYGWVYWHQNKNKEFVVTRVNQRWMLILLLATVAQFFIYYRLLLYFEGDRPLIDALLTAGSLSATYMMTRKWLENWAAWVLIDGAYVGLYLVKAMWLFAALYLVFTIMAAYGFFQWRRQSAK